MYFPFFVLHDWCKRSAVQPQTIDSEVPKLSSKHRVGKRDEKYRKQKKSKPGSPLREAGLDFSPALERIFGFARHRAAAVSRTASSTFWRISELKGVKYWL